MYLLPTNEQLELIAVTNDVLAAHAPAESIRQRRDEPVSVSDHDWRALAEVGLLGLGLPESAGGVGAGITDEVLVFSEIGRTVAPGPFLPCVVGAQVALAAEDDELAAAIAAGEQRVGLVVGMPGHALTEGRITGPAWVVDLPGNGLCVVATALGGGDAVGLVRVQDDTAWVAAVDPAVRLARTEFTGTELQSAGEWSAVILTRMTLLVAAELAGVARGCLEASVKHAKEREQFGRPIGVNQAIKHACADMAVRAEAAAAQVSFAAASCEGGHADAALNASAALVVAADAAQRNAAANLQVHGGMGFTYEHDAHFYVKRAERLRLLLGGRTAQLAALVNP